MSSLTAALEGNLGIALLAAGSPINRGQRQRLITRPLAHEPRRIEVAAGISTDLSIAPQILAFVEELKRAAAES